MANGNFDPTAACQVMPKPVGPACNMACSYCYYTQKTGIGDSCGNRMMSERLLELFIRQFLLSQKGDCISITWHGGEPLLRGIEFFEKAVKLQRKYAGGRQVENSIQTNGALVDGDWCRFFHENRFLVGLSIDGPEHVHDRYRRDRSGHETFSRAIRAMRLFQEHKVEFNTLSTINDYSSQFPVEIYRFFKEQGVDFMQFIPVVECLSHPSKGARQRLLPPGERIEKRVAPWSVRPGDYGRFLTAVFDEWVAGDVGRCFVPLFDAVLGNWCGAPASLCVLAKECGNAAVLEHDGSLYSCDHYVFPEHRLGNIGEKSLFELMRSGRHKRFGRRKSERLTSECRACGYLFLCRGECPRNRFAVSPSGERGHNYLCEGLKLFFSHTEHSMRFMRNELLNGRPAANVMGWRRRMRA
ncbi:MAG: anaerobic sulfatase maturase [Syntrophales bacterium]|nr:anaerobic sulfatase maturase [Syntrophales bacterium]